MAKKICIADLPDFDPTEYLNDETIWQREK